MDNDILALRGASALAGISQASMLPNMNPFNKKIEDLSSNELDIAALLAFGANMMQSPLQNDNNSTHNLQSKMNHRQENRPHHQNNNYSRWKDQHDRRADNRNDRGNRNDYNRRNRHSRR